MRSAHLFRLLLSTVVAAAGTVAADQPAPTPPPQSVVVPSLPDEQNKQGTVKPSGALQTDADGNLKTSRSDPPPPGGASSPGAGARQAAPAGSTAPLPVGPAPTSKGVTTGANYLQLRGFVQTVEAGKSITVKIQRTGATVTYTLAEKASVPKNLKQGELVRVRINALEKGRVADRVERITPTPVPSPPAPPAT